MTNSKLNKELHIKYWQRCLNSLLPTGYTSTDSSRMSLGFFILSALDLLSSPPLPCQRTQIRNWILNCQHPSGGFCGSSNHKYPDAYYGGGREEMDPANLPATYFALLSLSFVGRLEGVHRVKCLRWLKRLQRPDGSFGELVTKEGVVEGGNDMRHCFVAMSVRWVLRGYEKDPEVEDIDVEKLVAHLRAGQTFDGGISESSSHEAHAGYAYCAIASLSLLDQLPDPSRINESSETAPGLTDLPSMIRWLVSRQLQYRDVDEDSEDEGSSFEKNPNPLGGIYANIESSLDNLLVQEDMFVGFNGRTNKRADTCYAFWVVASLSMLGQADLIDSTPIRQFLFEKTQHQIGGFGKCPGDPPDIYHSYLGLAVLSTMGDPDLKAFDASLSVSSEQRQKVDKLGKEALAQRSFE